LFTKKGHHIGKLIKIWNYFRINCFIYIFICLIRSCNYIWSGEKTCFYKSRMGRQKLHHATFCGRHRSFLWQPIVIFVYFSSIYFELIIVRLSQDFVESLPSTSIRCR
jgi:hypothetical protein